MLFSETLSLNGGSLQMTGIDLGGHRQVRRVWRDYYQSVDTVVFMVDAADPSRLPEAQEELKRVLTDHQLADRPIAVLANKVDAQVSDSLITTASFSIIPRHQIQDRTAGSSGVKFHLK